MRVLYDKENLYLGVIAYDSNPDGILATELRRDALSGGFGSGGVGGGGGGGRGGSDDTFTVLLDTFHDGRNAFVFRVNRNFPDSDCRVTLLPTVTVKTPVCNHRCTAFSRDPLPNRRLAAT